MFKLFIAQLFTHHAIRYCRYRQLSIRDVDGNGEFMFGFLNP